MPVKSAPASKRVIVAIEVDSQFVSLLNSEIALSKIREKAMGDFGRAELTPSQQLSLVLLAEMRGATEAEVWQLTMPMWRQNIEVKHDMRKVLQE